MQHAGLTEVECPTCWLCPFVRALLGNTDMVFTLLRQRGGRPSGRPRIATRDCREADGGSDGGGRPSGRPRIATSAVSAWGRGGVVAVALRGGRGSQPAHRAAAPPRPRRGGRPSGRPRIATRYLRVTVPRSHCGGRPSGRPRIATSSRTMVTSPETLWRSPFGAAEDRNLEETGLRYGEATWRSPFGAAEDRNRCARRPRTKTGRWRSPFGAAEDRNLQRAGDKANQLGRGGRPSGRPRIATYM